MFIRRFSTRGQAVNEELEIILFSDVLTKFNQYSIGGFWVEKTNQFIVSASFWFFIDQAKAFLFKPLHFCMNIINVKGNMMNTLASFFNKFCNGAFRVCRFQQFYF